MLAEGRRSDADELGRRIAAAKLARSGKPDAAARSESRGWAVGIEFVGAVLVSGAIGWGIDAYAGLHSKPFGMIVFLVLGFAAGVRRAMQTSAQFDNSAANDARQ